MTCKYCVTKTTCSKLRKCGKNGARLYTAQATESSAESGFSQMFYEDRNSNSYSEWYSDSDSSSSSDSGSYSSCD